MRIGENLLTVHFQCYLIRPRLDDCHPVGRVGELMRVRCVGCTYLWKFLRGNNQMVLIFLFIES
jgi:hypothetical protein